MVRLAPDLEKRFLEDVVRLRFFVDDAADQGAQRTRIARIEFLQRLLPPLGDFAASTFHRT